MAILVVAALKPFWAKFTEGLADLAVRIIEYKLKQRWPDFGKDAEEIPAKNEGGESAKEIRAAPEKRQRGHGRHRSPPRHKK